MAKLTAWLLLCAVPVLVSVKLVLQGIDWPLIVYGVASLLAFGMYWYDKRSALNGRWRTPEKHLHLIELLGGWPGALLAQQVFRHKTRKLSFQIVFWLIVLAHQVVLLDYLYVRALVPRLIG